MSRVMKKLKSKRAGGGGKGRNRIRSIVKRAASKGVKGKRKGGFRRLSGFNRKSNRLSRSKKPAPKRTGAKPGNYRPTKRRSIRGKVRRIAKRVTRKVNRGSRSYARSNRSRTRRG